MRHAFLGLALIGSLTSTLSADEGTTGVLRSEISAEKLDRRAALQAMRADPESNAAWWQSGYVRLHGDWQPLETAAPMDAQLWREYKSRRITTDDTPAAQIKLANWCGRRGLTAQERAHLTRALWFEPIAEPEKILKRLGYRQIGQAWFTEEELKDFTQKEQAIARTAKKLVPQMEALAVRLDRNADERVEILQELAALIVDEASLAVLERTFSLRSESAALASIEVLSRIASYRSSQSLARLALVSDVESVRRAAIDQLRQRPWEDFVPMTLDVLSKPVEAHGSFGQSFPAAHPLAHRREWQYLFLREGRHRIEARMFSVVDSDSEPVTPIKFNKLSRLRETEDLRRHALDQLQANLKQIDLADDRMSVVNARAGDMLGAVTSLPATDDPEFWWTWWDETVETPSPGDKAIVLVSEDEVDTRAPLLNPSCLAAGTLVWTAQGLVAIEKIKIGDLVLAKDITTGELAYKPVLQTTHRHNAPLTNLTVVDETFAASGGHNFWISGRGWLRTNQITEPQTAHTATGAATMTAEDGGRSADVFNLVVADFHTYFVGKSLVLGHDVLAPAPTDHVVPGLKPVFAAAK